MRYDLQISEMDVPFHELTHEEFATLDRFGRLQLPQSFTEGAGKGSRVKLTIEDGRVVITPTKSS
jgi:hypothetical protein